MNWTKSLMSLSSADVMLILANLLVSTWLWSTRYNLLGGKLAETNLKFATFKKFFYSYISVFCLIIAAFIINPKPFQLLHLQLIHTHKTINVVVCYLPFSHVAVTSHCTISDLLHLCLKLDILWAENTSGKTRQRYVHWPMQCVSRHGCKLQSETAPHYDGT